MLEKIVSLYPELVNQFLPRVGIVLQDDGQGVYIAKWEHPTLARPTEEQLA